MKNLSNIPEIEAYLQGDMSESDMIELEVRMLEDEAFRTEFHTMKIIWNGIKASAKKSSLADKIKQLQTADTASPSLEPIATSKPGRIISFVTQHKKIFYPIGIALLIAIIGLVAIPLPFFGEPTPEQMFANHFVVSPNFDYRSARGTANDPGIYQAYRAYDQGDYTIAAQLLEGLVAADPAQLTHQFYLGNCYLMLEKWEEAINALQEPAFANLPISDDAKWYLGLAYLRIGDKKNAILLLKETTRMQDRERMARSMLRTLDK